MFMSNFFYGVCEDRKDPLKLGRVRVRIFGIHSELKVPAETEGSPTDWLLWCYPMQPITSAAISGIGTTPLGLVEGTNVVGFFRDNMCQDGVIMGSLGGIPTKPANPNSGFNDPNGKYPLKEYINEPDTNRLARNDEGKLHPVVEKKRDSLETINIPFGGEIEEPVTPYDAEYPYNHVRQTESGHIVEYDDTPSKERIHVYHRSGSFVEVHPDGTEVHKIVGDDFEISLKDKNVLVKGNLVVNIQGDSKILVDGNTELEVNGNSKQLIHGNVEQTVGGNVNQTIEQNMVSEVTGDYTLSCANYTLNVNGSKVDTVKGSWTRKASTINDTADGAFTRKGSAISDTGSGGVVIKGATIALN